MRIGELKAKAKESLRGRKLKAGLASLVYILIVGIIPAIINYILLSTLDKTPASIINVIITIVISSLMVVGFYRYLINFSDREKDTELSLLFSGTDSFFKVILFQILLSVFIFVIIFISVLIGAAAIFASKFNIAIIIILIILGIVLYVGLIYISLRLSFCIMIFAENRASGVIAAIKTSWKLTKGHVGKIFLTGLSFILWIIFCILIIPIFYVLPYVQLTLINLYYDLKNSQKDTSIN